MRNLISLLFAFVLTVPSVSTYAKNYRGASQSSANSLAEARRTTVGFTGESNRQAVIRGKLKRSVGKLQSSAMWGSLNSADDGKLKAITTQEFSTRNFVNPLSPVRSNFPVRQFTQARQRTPEVISALPTNSTEFEAVFNRHASSRQQEIMSRHRSELELLTRASNSDILDNIRNSSSDFIIILGHNFNGGFRTLSGRSVELAQIYASCHLVGKLCFVISCRSELYIEQRSNVQGRSPDATNSRLFGSSFGLKTAIGYEDAVRLSHVIVALLNSCDKGVNQTDEEYGDEIMTAAVNTMQREGIRMKVVVTEGASNSVWIGILIGSAACVRAETTETKDDDCPGLN
jgi:hypothetical protein